MKVTFNTTFNSALAAALLAGAGGAALLACGGGASSPPDEPAAAAPATLAHASDVPVDGLGADDVARFRDGDDVFDLPFRERDGLGPLYVRSSCGACHDGAARGPGLVRKMAVVGVDGVTAAADQTKLPFGHTIREGLAAGAKTPIDPPDDPSVKVTTRVGPPVLGRGYLEAIADAEIERVAAEQAARTDGIHGRINRVTYASTSSADPAFGAHVAGEKNLIGRFGLKARVATVDDFVADAFQGDMGLTTPMRPNELPNPDGLTDDAKPGVDLDLDHVARVAFYVRRIAIPARVGLTDRGRALFDRALCSVCHVPSLKTRADYPIAQLANVDAPVYTDLLLHDMGPALADGMTDESADSPGWRTAPLIGVRFSKTFLHDGRATTIEQAIAAHDGEGRASADAFAGLSPDDRDALLRFVEAL